MFRTGGITLINAHSRITTVVSAVVCIAAIHGGTYTAYSRADITLGAEISIITGESVTIIDISTIRGTIKVIVDAIITNGLIFRHHVFWDYG